MALAGPFQQKSKDLVYYQAQSKRLDYLIKNKIFPKFRKDPSKPNLYWKFNEILFQIFVVTFADFLNIFESFYQIYNFYFKRKILHYNVVGCTVKMSLIKLFS